MSSVDNDTTIYDESLEDDFKEYGIGESLNLIPHLAALPYGPPFFGPFPGNKPIEDYGFSGENGDISRTERVCNYRPTGFVPQIAEPGGGILAIERILAGGSEAGPQVVLCRTVVHLGSAEPGTIFPRAGDRVVAKIFDPMFYPWEYNPLQGPWNESTIADRAFSREAAAYEKLEKEGKHGYPHIAPRFWGTYVIPRSTKNINVPPHQRGRLVGLVLMEYIPGHLMSDLCDINQYDTLIPKPNPPIAAGLELRLKVLRILLHGYVEQLHAGVEQRLIRPENVLISHRGGLHVTLLNYSQSVVDETCEKPLRLYEGWPHPPHPFEKFGPEKLSYLAGWFPSEWRGAPEKMDEWLEGEFGPVENSNSYTVDPPQS